MEYYTHWRKASTPGDATDVPSAALFHFLGTCNFNIANKKCTSKSYHHHPLSALVLLPAVRNVFSRFYIQSDVCACVCACVRIFSVGLVELHFGLSVHCLPLNPLHFTYYVTLSLLRES